MDFMLILQTTQFKFVYLFAKLIILIMLGYKGKIWKKDFLWNSINLPLLKRSQCWCGDSVGKYGVANCTRICPGDKSEICGGAFSNSVYKIPSKLI